MAPFGMSTKAFLDRAGVFEIFFTFLLFAIGCTADASWYLLFGNSCCFVGNILWVYTLGTFPGNENMQIFFGLLVVVSAVPTYVQGKKCWENPPPLFEDSDDEDGEEEAPKVLTASNKVRVPRNRKKAQKQLKNE